MEETKKHRKTMVGKVIKISTSDTIKVRIETKSSHPLYKRVIRTHKNYLAHCDDSSVVNVGETVTIEESRPFSKLKKWKLVTK